MRAWVKRGCSSAVRYRRVIPSCRSAVWRNRTITGGRYRGGVTVTRTPAWKEAAVPDRLARLTNLVALLLNARRPLTLEEIAAELDPEAPYPGADEARRQAFERDKRVLREEGIPVEAVSLDGEGGRVGYRIRPEEYQLPDLDLTADERIALHLALAAV